MFYFYASRKNVKMRGHLVKVLNFVILFVNLVSIQVILQVKMWFAIVNNVLTESAAPEF